MQEELLKAIPVFLSSALKFIFGPLEGYGLRLHFITTILATVGGMMTSVVIFTYFGDWLRQRFLRRLFQKKESKAPTGKTAVLIRKYGLGGIAFLTPLFLTPIGGTILAVGLGKPKEKILLYMLISALAWAVVFTSIIYFVGHKVLPDFIK
jgi:membrane protein DedA with SNARE-associated domain